MYQHIKTTKFHCPKCSRPLELLLAEDVAVEPVAICFRCRSLQLLSSDGPHTLPTTALSALNKPTQTTLLRKLQQLSERYQYQATGNQRRLNKQQQLQRQWLSLAEYERIFQEPLGFAAIDLRKTTDSCKWCAQPLPQGRRSFCKDSCSRNYSRWTFSKRSLAALPYRIACRDRFYCQVSGQDLAYHNRFAVRIPASAGQLAVHHLIHVAENGTDHEQNLLTLHQQVHQDYHSGLAYAVTAIHRIRDQRLQQYHTKMLAK